ncbi:hypothetical protein ACFL6A_00945 [bacterium]
MKKLAFVLMLVIIPIQLSAQVFGTGQTLKPGRMSLGVNPAAYLNTNNNDFYLFLHGGIGMSRRMDLGIKVGVLGDVTYFGADLEWCLSRRSPHISISVGAHHYNEFGLDGILNFTFPLGRRMSIYTGLDLDVNFINGNTTAPFWLFIGSDISIARRIGFLIEAEIGINASAYNIISGGFNFYL